MCQQSPLLEVALVHLDKPWIGSELPIGDNDLLLFSAATRVTVNNGRTARFWTSSWIDGVSPAAMCPALFKHSKHKKRSVAEGLGQDNWIRDIQLDLTAALLNEYVTLWVEIQNWQHDTTRDQTCEDVITWTRTSSGEYSASSAYNMQFDGGLGSWFPKKVWKVWAPSRCKTFMWLLLQN